MDDKLLDSIYDAARIAEDESHILDDEYFQEHEFEIFMKPDGTIRLLRESEYFAEVPEGWKKVGYENHSNDELTIPEYLQEIVQEWIDANNKQ